MVYSRSNACRVDTVCLVVSLLTTYFVFYCRYCCCCCCLLVGGFGLLLSLSFSMSANAETLVSTIASYRSAPCGNFVHNSATAGQKKPASSLIRWESKQWFSMLELQTELLSRLDAEENQAPVVTSAEQAEQKEVPATEVVVKKKKSVTFADEFGCQLVTIRILTEPSEYVPPNMPCFGAKLATQQSKQCTESSRPTTLERGNHAAVGGSSWVLNFSQPASDYAKFRHKLNQNNVVLENVLLRNDIQSLHGTVKVKNLAFEKEVYVRCTTDEWATFQDHPATFLCNTSGIFDTFLFDFEIPLDDDTRQRIEFCISYRVAGQQFWDNNDNANYELISDRLRKQRLVDRSHIGDEPNRRWQTNGGNALRPNSTSQWSEYLNWAHVSSPLHYW
ncbi:Protein phosphatase 1 regulatory subunit 3B [Trichinella patagoniensis]|uniref:Protein phosphatase 1 regulatory subunit 3B n=1 Tax=Trichinella patagoniensis TaxID=990121 RepID=A0A0V1AEI6_9BILA|nr:Protein phosphatase 1 regulatory subunit 3B [Trichinella patagoniensis]